jgi:hypothetical protein
MNTNLHPIILGTLALIMAATLPTRAQPGTKNQRDDSVAQWRGMRVGLFIHWGPSSGRALPQSHSHARKSALNPHGSVPAEVNDQFYQVYMANSCSSGNWQFEQAIAVGLPGVIA